MNKILLTTLTLLTLLGTNVSCAPEKEEIEAVEASNKDSSDTTTDYEKEIMRLINEYRKKTNLTELKILKVAKSQTDFHTNYMIEKSKISHDNFNAIASFLRKKANALGMAENVASGYNSAENVLKGWLNSKGHRENIEGNYTHFNLTAKKDSKGKWYYTCVFVLIK